MRNLIILVTASFCFMIMSQDAEARRGGFLRLATTAVKAKSRADAREEREKRAEEEAAAEAKAEAEAAATPVPTPTPTPTPPPAPTPPQVAQPVYEVPEPVVVVRTPIPDGTATRIHKVNSVHSLTDMNGRIELLGVDPSALYAANMSNPGIKKEAVRILEKMLEDQTVYLYFDKVRTDETGVRTAYVFLADGTNLNEFVISSGFARTSNRFPISRQKQFLACEADAQRCKRGIWAQSKSAGSDKQMVGSASGSGQSAQPRYLNQQR